MSSCSCKKEGVNGLGFGGGFEVRGFWVAFVAKLILSVLNMILGAMLSD